MRPFWEEPVGSGLFGRIAALRIRVKTPSLDPDSRLALHPKQGKLALTPIYEMSSIFQKHGREGKKKKKRPVPVIFAVTADRPRGGMKTATAGGYCA